MDLSKLNEQQRDAVQTTEGPLLILAGAGSGKTTVLVNRIAYLIEEKKIAPYHILAITFTNKAANEMRERIDSLIGERGARIWAKTFHSTCLQILRFEEQNTDLKPNFVIYDSSDQMSIVKRALKKFNIDTDLVKPSNILHIISNMKNSFYDINQALQVYKDDAIYNDDVIWTIEEYQRVLAENNAIDFDDILRLTVKLFIDHPDILEYYQDRFQYILVDEYQDTNKIQYEFVQMLSSKYQNICIVGDDDQSIYQWRGADVQNILSFESDYPKAKVIKLEENYRSTKKILNLANEIIANNAIRKEKSLWTRNIDGESTVYFEADDDKDEGYFIARQIKDLKNKSNYSYNDFAILIRTTSQFRSLEECLLKNNIPYRIYGGIKFFQRKEIKDIVAYLSVISNPNDALNMRRIINIPKRGIGEQSWNKILELHSTNNKLTLLDCLIHPSLKLSSKASKAVHEFYNMIKNAKEVASNGEMITLLEFILNSSGYIEYLYETEPMTAEFDKENIDEFLSIAANFDAQDLEFEERSLSSFLEGIALYTDLDQKNDNESYVSVMTMHSSKGLEFPVVFIAGFEENLFPHIRSKNENGLEEERRLCYVSFTRAKDQLYITSAKKRLIHGKFMYNRPSEFYSELDDRYFINANRRGYINNKITPAAKKISKSSASCEFKVGDKIRHKSWKDGIIVSVDKDDPYKLTVAFPNEGIKVVSAKYAPIEKI